MYSALSQTLTTRVVYHVSDPSQRRQSTDHPAPHLATPVAPPQLSYRADLHDTSTPTPPAAKSQHDAHVDKHLSPATSPPQQRHNSGAAHPHATTPPPNLHNIHRNAAAHHTHHIAHHHTAAHNSRTARLPEELNHDGRTQSTIHVHRGPTSPQRTLPVALAYHP